MLKKVLFISIFLSLFLNVSNALAKDETVKLLDKATYTVIAKFTVKKDQIDNFLKEMKINETASRNEPGVVSYRVYRSSEKETVFFNVEAFKNKAAFDAHMETAHVKALISSLDLLLDGEVVVDVVESF